MRAFALYNMVVRLSPTRCLPALLLVVCVVVGGGSPAGAAAAAAPPTLPAGFITDDLATGLDQPTGFAFEPDGTAYVTEKTGRVYRVTRQGTRTLWLDLNSSGAVPKVNAWWDRGLVGIALDGQWATHRFLYLLYVADDDPQDGLQDDDPHSSVLVRVPVTLAGAAGLPTVILGTDGLGAPCAGPREVQSAPLGYKTLDGADYNDDDCLPIDGDTHAVGTVRAAPDGTLYVGTGDGAPYDGISALPLRSLRDDTFAGKIIRVDRAGNGLPGHPFCPAETDLDTVCAKVFAKGFRNPFRFQLDPDGRVFAGDVGWGSREEIDHVQAGATYGWPCWEGSEVNGNYSWHALCQPYVTNGSTPVGVTMPIWEYSRAGVGGAIVGGPVYTGTAYPTEYRGARIVGDYAQGWVRALPANGAGGWNLTPALVTSWASTSALPLAGMAFGPASSPWTGVDLGTHPANGDVVYADIGESESSGLITPNTGALRRIRYLPGNGRPVAVAVATPASGAAPLLTTLSAAGSSDPDGDLLTYAWDLDANGTTDATTASVTHTYAAAGAYRPKLTVSDGRLTQSATVLVTVQETPPTAEIVAAESDTTFAGGAPITLRGKGTDAQDGALSGAALRWDVQLVHGDHTHPLGTYHGTAPPLPDGIDDHDADTHYTIRLTATDSAGLTDSVTWRLDPRTATVKLRSLPDGAAITYGGQAHTAPDDHLSTVGLRTSVVAVETFAAAGRTYDFRGWSDGASAARARELTVPSAGVTLTAEYDVRPLPVTDPPPVDPPASDPPLVPPATPAAGGGAVPVTPVATGPGPAPSGGGKPVTPPLALRPLVILDPPTFAAARVQRLTGRVRELPSARRVQVAVRRLRGTRCAWWARTAGTFTAPTTCGTPAWMGTAVPTKATTRRWRLELRGTLAPGRYTVMLRALDGAGAPVGTVRRVSVTGGDR